jgi:hypothetical protein
MDLPKYDKSSKTGEVGLTIVKEIVENKLNWIFRKNHQETDFGIDAYFDIIAEKNSITGKSIAVQIKSGDSYFKEPNELGWTFRGEMKHLNYYLNHEIPVIIIIVDIENKSCYWNLCDPYKTVKAGDNWKMTIPSNQKLDTKSKQSLLKFVSPVTDYVSQLDLYWTINKLFLDTERVFFVVSKDDIIKNSYSYLRDAFKRLEDNPELILHLRGKVDVTIHGYDDDPRELFEIKEVLAWTRKVLPKISGLAYFLNKDKAGQFLKTLFVSHIDFILIKKDPKASKNYIKFDKEEYWKFIDLVFENLNDFQDKHNISHETNEILSKQVIEYITGYKFN